MVAACYAVSSNSGITLTVRPPPILIFISAAAYAIVVSLAISQHEPWADEAQAWLLARDATLTGLWVRLLHYEGSPGLWHSLLHALQWGGLPYSGLNIVSGLLGFFATCLTLWFAPLPLVVRLLLPFTYFLCYQYAVIARSYSLLPVVLVLCAVYFDKRGKGVFAFTAFLCLMAAVSGHAMALSMSIWVGWQLSGRGRSKLAAGMYFSVLLLLVLTAWPARDVAFPFHAQLTLARAFGVTAVMLGNAFTGHWLPSLLVLALSIRFLWRGGGFAMFCFSTLSVCAFSVIVYWNAWSQGLLFLGWVFSIWIAASHTKIDRLTLAALIIVISCQCYWTARSVFYDWSYPYSGSRAVAGFLQKENISQAQIYAFGYSCAAIQPYFAQNQFANWNSGGPAAYWDWSNRNRSNDVTALSSAGRPEYVMVGYKTDAELGQWAGLLKANGYQESRHFDGNLFFADRIMESEAFYLFRRIAMAAAASTVNTPDPETANQLVSGFYGVESNAWRWTSRAFSIALKTPAGGQDKGARLELRFAIPAIQMQKLGSMTLAAEIAGYSPDPQTYSHPGNYTYVRLVPASALNSAVATVKFRWDKASPPSASDSRELGAIVASAGFYPK